MKNSEKFFSRLRSLAAMWRFRLCCYPINDYRQTVSKSNMYRKYAYVHSRFFAFETFNNDSMCHLSTFGFVKINSHQIQSTTILVWRPLVHACQNWCWQIYYRIMKNKFRPIQSWKSMDFVEYDENRIRIRIFWAFSRPLVWFG